MRIQRFKRPGMILENLQDGRYASSLAGVRDIRYFSIGQRGQPPYIDMAYALGGFWYHSPTRQVYWCALDKQWGCALIRCDDKGKVSVIYSEQLPACFQIAGGEEETGHLLLHAGIIDRGWFRAGDYIIVNPSSLSELEIAAHHIGHHCLPSTYVPDPSPLKAGQVVRGATAGEFQLRADSPYLARMALSEGEVPELSLWAKEQNQLRRIAPALNGVETWTWLSHRSKLIVIASTGVYTSVPSIVVWYASRSNWEVVKRFSGYTFVQIIRVDGGGTVNYEAIRERRRRERGTIRVM